MNKWIVALSLAAVFLPMAGTDVFAQTKSTKEDEKNLLPNGRFIDNPEDPLEGWTYIFTDNVHYRENHLNVAVVKKESPDVMSFPSDPERWLRLDGRDNMWTWVLGGVQIYSPIIRYNPKMRYKITVRARSLHARLPHVSKVGSNPSCRIYPISYIWHPKAQKSNTPQLTDLREAVRHQPMYFDGTSVTGEHSKLQTAWKTVSVVIPPMGRSALQERYRENAVWLSVKFLVMDGGEFNTGFMDIAEVKIEEVGPVDEVKLAPGAATKGADGKAWSGGGADTKKLTPVGPTPAKK